MLFDSRKRQNMLYFLSEKPISYLAKMGLQERYKSVIREWYPAKMIGTENESREQEEKLFWK